MRHDKTNSKKLLIKMSPRAVCELNEAVEIVIHDCQITVGSEPSMTTARQLGPSEQLRIEAMLQSNSI